MSEPIDPKWLALAAASAATGAAVNLIEFGRGEEDPIPGELQTLEVVEHLADATKLAIEASGQMDEETGQLLGALVRFLEGWA